MDTLMPPVLASLTILAAQTASTDSLIWAQSPIGDFKLYAVYRDTVEGFVPAESLCIDSVNVQADTAQAYTNSGVYYYYKVSAVDDTSYGGGYVSVAGALLQVRKDLTLYNGNKAPGDTILYTIYYDNDGEVNTSDTADIVDFIPRFTMFLDTAGYSLNNGAGGINIDYYVKDNGWREDMPTLPTDSIIAVRWQIISPIQAHSDAGDVTGADSAKTGVDTTQGDDSGWVRFKVRIR
jgi:uncharacterized repeat protein (TIGR01451 family)